MLILSPTPHRSQQRTPDKPSDHPQRERQGKGNADTPGKADGAQNAKKRPTENAPQTGQTGGAMVADGRYW
jgi:hypothetical protein